MEEILQKYNDKLVRAGLTEEGGALIGLQGAETRWNRSDEACKTLEEVMAGIHKQCY